MLTPCVEWPGAVNNIGYGVKKFNGRMWLAHRIAWTVERGAIPAGLLVLHKCDNRKCINIDHLFLGTYSDNTQDCIRKGRFAFGERNGAAVLTPAKVRRIKRCISNGEQTTSIARAFGVSFATIARIKRGETWKNV